MPIVFLRHFYIIYYVETALHVTVPLNDFARLLPNLKGFTQNEDFGEKNYLGANLREFLDYP